MAGEIWILVEQWRGRISDITYEVLALGREVAGGLGGSLQAVDALALAQIIPQRQPQALLIPQTNVTMELGPLLAARLAVPFLNSCRDVQVTDGRPVARCILYGGKVEASVTPQRAPAVFGILPGARPREQGRVERAPAVTEAS